MPLNEIVVENDHQEGGVYTSILLRIVTEAIYATFLICNHDVGKITKYLVKDILRQIIPTAYFLGTSNWIFYILTDRYPKTLCSCNRLNVICRHNYLQKWHCIDVDKKLAHGGPLFGDAHPGIVQPLISNLSIAFTERNSIVIEFNLSPIDCVKIDHESPEIIPADYPFLHIKLKPQSIPPLKSVLPSRISPQGHVERNTRSSTCKNRYIVSNASSSLLTQNIENLSIVSKQTCDRNILNCSCADCIISRNLFNNPDISIINLEDTTERPSSQDLPDVINSEHRAVCAKVSRGFKLNVANTTSIEKPNSPLVLSIPPSISIELTAQNIRAQGNTEQFLNNIYSPQQILAAFASSQKQAQQTSDSIPQVDVESTPQQSLLPIKSPNNQCNRVECGRFLFSPTPPPISTLVPNLYPIEEDLRLQNLLFGKRKSILLSKKNGAGSDGDVDHSQSASVISVNERPSGEELVYIEGTNVEITPVVEISIPEANPIQTPVPKAEVCQKNLSPTVPFRLEYLLKSPIVKSQKTIIFVPSPKCLFPNQILDWKSNQIPITKETIPRKDEPYSHDPPVYIISGHRFRMVKSSVTDTDAKNRYPGLGDINCSCRICDHNNILTNTCTCFICLIHYK